MEKVKAAPIFKNVITYSKCKKLLEGKIVVLNIVKKLRSVLSLVKKIRLRDFGPFLCYYIQVFLRAMSTLLAFCSS